MRAGTFVSPRVLEKHYLYLINCDHTTQQDQPVCACMKVDLGWHRNVGAAVSAWVEHVQDVQRAQLALLLSGETEDLRCGFCERSQHQAGVLVRGPDELGGLCICSECVLNAQGCVDEHWTRVWRDHGELEYDSWAGALR